jgi:hypothetical protein
MILRFLFAAILSLAIAGCASKGFNRGDLKEQIGVVKPVFDDSQIQEAYNKKKNLPKPFRLAVYFKTPPEARGTAPWRWTEQDKNTFDDIGNQLKSEGIVANVFPIIDSIVTTDDLRSLRLVAAKHQADALLIVSGGAQIDRYTNPWGWTYAFLAPVFFVPGSIADTLFMVNASLWDVKNEYLYVTAEGEATTSETYVAAFGKQDKELINGAKTQALAQLKGELKKMIQGNNL